MFYYSLHLHQSDIHVVRNPFNHTTCNNCKSLNSETIAKAVQKIVGKLLQMAMCGTVLRCLEWKKKNTTTSKHSNHSFEHRTAV